MKTVEQRQTVLIVADILREYMGLAEDVIALQNEPRRIAPKKGLFVDIAVIGVGTYANNGRAVNDPKDPEVTEVQTIGQREILQIDIFSKDRQAFDRIAEVPLALNSTIAVQACEHHGLKIARVPQSCVNVSHVEGAARINRFAFTVVILRAYSYARTVPTFDQFPATTSKEIVTNP
jgi:hypothetical protein